MAIRPNVLTLLWDGQDPFEGVLRDATASDLGGWNSRHALLAEAVERAPRIIVEVGVWKGGSVVFMAERLKMHNVDGVVIAVDTWLGSWEHWLRPEWRVDLQLERGYPTLYRTFQHNIVNADLVDYVVPLPLDSLNAASLLRHHGVGADVVHIDGGHDRRTVASDLDAWWERVNPGGAVLVDDYDPAGEVWPSVRAAVDEFVARVDCESFRSIPLKAEIRKPPAASA
jgi:predicted O-methyltransferase YrrM